MKKLILICALFLLALPSVFAANFIFGLTNNNTGGNVLRNETLGDCNSWTNGAQGSCSTTDNDLYDGPTDRGRIILGYYTNQIVNCSVNTIVATLNIYQTYNERQKTVGAYFVNWTWNEEIYNYANDLGRTGTAGQVNASNINSTPDSSTATTSTLKYYQWNVTTGVKRAVSRGDKNISWYMVGPENGDDGAWVVIRGGAWNHTTANQRHYLNVTCDLEAPDTTPPSITYYNLTSSTNGCENWNTDKTNACSTSSVTPTVQFNTNEVAYCAISGNFSSTSGMNYSDMGNSRNCTGATSGEGATSHLCTLTSQDELVYDTSYLYISCKDSTGNQNSTSTSGSLKLSIIGLEDAGRTSIGVGIQNALLSGYTNYTDQQIYARNLSNGQVRGTFDRAVKKSNKMWAFNRIGVSDSQVNMFNLTPVLYTLELANKTSSNITLEVEKLLNATK